MQKINLCCFSPPTPNLALQCKGSKDISAVAGGSGAHPAMGMSWLGWNNGQGVGCHGQGRGGWQWGEQEEGSIPLLASPRRCSPQRARRWGNGEIGCLWQRCFSRVALEQKDLFHQEKKKNTNQSPDPSPRAFLINPCTSRLSCCLTSGK